MKRILTAVPTCLVLSLLCTCGCDVAVDQYPANHVHALVVEASRNVPTETVAEDTTTLVDAWFGTPESPLWPAEQMSSDAARALVSIDNLQRAAGRVYSDQQNRHFGLYNEHCVTCHGVSGGGDGPASLLQNPYPRDFRAGVFKWKSTELSAKPTRGDLLRLLRHGAPGSAMPSFAAISEDDLEALVDYVIFLSVRGEFERRMLSGGVDELGYEDARPEDDLNLSLAAAEDAETDAADFARETIDQITNAWVRAEGKVVEVPVETVNDADSVARGREWFHGRVANCVGCHGTDGTPVEVALDYDDWTKEFTSRLSITPTDRDAVRPFRKAGALRPRQIYPRKLSDGVYRGGGDSETLYRRLVTGIAGTPMPAVAVVEGSAEEGNTSGVGLTSDQIWDIVHYLQSLSGDG